MTHAGNSSPPSPSGVSARAPRALFLDSTRGTAMFFVLAAHFVWIYFYRNPGHAFAPKLTSALQLAAPTFMLISGLLLGYTLELRPERFAAFATKLTDRGLFLLTVGHVIISLAYSDYAGGWSGAFRYAQIIDAVAVCIVVGPWLIRRSGMRTRALIALGLLTLTWIVVYAWHPVNGGLVFLKDTLFGGGLLGQEKFWEYNFPPAPWFAIYLFGTIIGQVIGRLIRSGEPAVATRLLLRIATASVISGVALKAGHVVWKRSLDGALPHYDTIVYALTDPMQKVPPSPAFILFNGGLGLFLMALMWHLERKGEAPGLLRFTSIIGQNSLFIFLLQEHIYVSWLWRLNPPYTPWWPLILLATMALALGITMVWHRLGLNRLLTVGYGTHWGPRPARAGVPSVA